MAFNHNSIVAESEPDWSDVDKDKLPDIAFADTNNRRFPHHWVKNGKLDPDTGRYTDGEMFLHKGGLQSALAASQGARSGEETSTVIKSHLQDHQKIVFPDADQKMYGIKSIVGKHYHNAIENVEVKGFGGFNVTIKEESSPSERIVYGLVYVPNRIDSHGDFMTAAEIDQMRSRFMRLYASSLSFFDNGHDFIPGAGMLEESWTVRKGDSLFTKDFEIGGWAVGVRVLDDFVWKSILAKKTNCFSLAGMVDVAQTVVAEITEEQAKGDYSQIEPQFDATKNCWLIESNEIVNARLVAVSFVERGANLEPRFPLIKTAKGWQQTRLLSAKNWKQYSRLNLSPNARKEIVKMMEDFKKEHKIGSNND